MGEGSEAWLSPRATGCSENGPVVQGEWLLQKMRMESGMCNVLPSPPPPRGKGA